MSTPPVAQPPLQPPVVLIPGVMTGQLPGAQIDVPARTVVTISGVRLPFLQILQTLTYKIHTYITDLPIPPIPRVTITDNPNLVIPALVLTGAGNVELKPTLPPPAPPAPDNRHAITIGPFGQAVSLTFLVENASNVNGPFIPSTVLQDYNNPDKKLVLTDIATVYVLRADDGFDPLGFKDTIIVVSLTRVA